MKITTYIELTPAQEHTIQDFQNVVVRADLAVPQVVATFRTFQAQDVKATIDENGGIKSVTLTDVR